LDEQKGKQQKKDYKKDPRFTENGPEVEAVSAAAPPAPTVEKDAGNDEEDEDPLFSSFKRIRLADGPSLADEEDDEDAAAFCCACWLDAVAAAAQLS
jgi:hypothetical protein